MQAEVKTIISPDIDINNYFPENTTSFGFLIQVVVGIKGKEGGDTFNMEICTPQWILENYSDREMIFGRGKLIVFQYDVDAIFKRVNRYCESCYGETWDEIVDKVSRIGLWEFEDYRTQV